MLCYYHIHSVNFCEFINIVLHTVSDLISLNINNKKTNKESVDTIFIKIENGDIVLFQQGFGCLDSI